MSDEDAAKLANRFELPGIAEAFWGPEDRPDVRPESTAEKPLTFVSLWCHALGLRPRRA